MGRIDLENFPTSGSALRMLDDVSAGFYENSYVGKWLFQVMGLEYDDAFQLAEELPKQFFPETATWGLRYHEEKWGLPVRESLDYEDRRRLIYRKRDYLAPMTPYRMEIYLHNATGLNVRISDCHDAGLCGFEPYHPNVFRVDFIGGSTKNVIKALRILNTIKQSHTTYIMRHSLIGETAGLKAAACSCLGGILKVKAKLAESIRAADRLPALSGAAMGGILKVKPYLTENLPGTAADRTKAYAAQLLTEELRVKTYVTESIHGKKAEKTAQAGVLEAGSIKIKAKTEKELRAPLKVRQQGHQRMENRMEVKKAVGKER